MANQKSLNKNKHHAFGGNYFYSIINVLNEMNAMAFSATERIKIRLAV